MKTFGTTIKSSMQIAQEGSSYRQFKNSFKQSIQTVWAHYQVLKIRRKEKEENAFFFLLPISICPFEWESAEKRNLGIQRGFFVYFVLASRELTDFLSTWARKRRQINEERHLLYLFRGANARIHDSTWVNTPKRVHGILSLGCLRTSCVESKNLKHVQLCKYICILWLYISERQERARTRANED